MSSIRFEPSVSATFAIDRNPAGTGGDLFADMLGEHMKKRAAADRPDPLTRRKPQVDRPIHEDERPASRRPGVIIKHAHDLRDVATDARDVTPRKDEQARLAALADHSGACMDDQAPTGEAPASEAGSDEATVDAIVVEAAPDKEQPTDQQQPVLVTVQVAPEAPAEAAAEIVAVAVDPQAPLPADGQLAPAADAEPAAVTPADPLPAESAPAEAAPVDPQASTANPDAPEEKAEAQANFAATLAASLGDTMAGLAGGDAAIDAAAGAEALASVSMTTLATPKADTPVTAEAPQVAAVELAANLTPETPRPAAEAKAKPAVRAIPASEIKAQAAGTQPAANPQPQPAAQALAHAAPNAAFNRALDDGFDTGFGNDGVGAPGWTLHLAQGAASKRPDFVAQLRQHLQELPAHEQVAVNIQRAIRQGTNQMTIQLSPAELGKIHVKLEIDEEKRVTAAVTVEKPSTLELLQRDVKGLERALQEAGLKMDGSDLSFNLGRQDGNEFSQEMRQAGTAGFGSGAGEAQAEGDVAAAQAAQVDTATGLVNVQI